MEVECRVQYKSCALPFVEKALSSDLAGIWCIAGIMQAFFESRRGQLGFREARKKHQL